MVDLDAWEERAAIMQFDAGMSRFEAETQAAKQQGFTRWEVLEIINANRIGNTRQGGDNRPAHVGNGSDNLPGMQPASEAQDRAMPERLVPAGRGSVALLALQS